MRLPPRPDLALRRGRPAVRTTGPRARGRRAGDCTRLERVLDRDAVETGGEVRRVACVSRADRILLYDGDGRLFEPGAAGPERSQPVRTALYHDFGRPEGCARARDRL